VLLTTTTASPELLLREVGTLGRLVERRVSGALVLGVHLEGPWIASSQRGMQGTEAIRPPDIMVPAPTGGRRWGAYAWSHWRPRTQAHCR